jgi:hypothetical protein
MAVAVAEVVKLRAVQVVQAVAVMVVTIQALLELQIQAAVVVVQGQIQVQALRGLMVAQEL